jgi:hypothetical protein
MRRDKINALVLLAFAATWSAGCASRTPFTKELREAEALTDAEVQSLQFYLGGRIVLQRETSSTERAVAGHQLVKQHGKTIDEIAVENDTPGIATKVSATEICVSFDPEDALRFVSEGNERSFGYYRFLPEASPVNYAGRVYQTPEGVRTAVLTIDMDQLSKLIKNRRTLKGRRLD